MENKFEFDDDQSNVLKAKDRIRLINAGPGSGKTTLIVHAAVIEALHINSSSKVLGLCHTNAAVNNANQKLASIPYDYATKGKIDFRTIHSFAGFCLSEYGKQKQAYKFAQLKIDSEEYKKACEKVIKGFCKWLRKEKNRRLIANKFKVIIVDELQDISDDQWAIIKLLAGNENTLIAVGDPKQTLFMFSGASFERFNQFMADFPDCKLFSLTANHRSTKEIVRLAHEVIKQTNYIKPLKTKAEVGGPLPKVICSSANYQLYEYTTDSILQYKEDGGSLNDIAILYRNRPHAFGLRSHLLAKGIPFMTIGDEKKEDSALIKVLFAAFNIVEDEASSHDWHKMLLKIDEIGGGTVQKIMNWLPSRLDNTFPKKLRFTDSLKDLLDFIDLMKESSLELPVNLGRIINYVCRLPKVNYSRNDSELATLRVHAQSSSSLAEVIAKYNDSSFGRFYPNKTDSSYPDEYVTLSTIHGKKGGESPIVFLVGGDNDSFEKYSCFKDKESMEQELQSTYVAVTRAKRDLHILFPVGISTWDRAGDEPNPIRFIKRASPDSYQLEFLDG